MCNGEIMGKDHTLEFVYMTRWRVKVRRDVCVLWRAVGLLSNDLALVLDLDL